MIGEDRVGDIQDRQAVDLHLFRQRVDGLACMVSDEQDAPVPVGVHDGLIGRAGLKVVVTHQGHVPRLVVPCDYDAAVADIAATAATPPLPPLSDGALHPAIQTVNKAINAWDRFGLIRRIFVFISNLCHSWRRRAIDLAEI